MDFTEIHSFMTRSEAILQNPEFSISRKEGSVADLYEKVLVRQHDTDTWYSVKLFDKLIFVYIQLKDKLQTPFYIEQCNFFLFYLSCRQLIKKNQRSLESYRKQRGQLRL